MPTFHPQRALFSQQNWAIVKHVSVHCKRHKLPSVKAATWTGAHMWAHPDTHRNVWMFFPGSQCGLCIPHSFLALCVLADLSKIQWQTILTALWSQRCRHHRFSNTKHTHTQTHIWTHTHLTRSTAEQSLYVMQQPWLNSPPRLWEGAFKMNGCSVNSGILVLWGL